MAREPGSPPGALLRARAAPCCGKRAPGACQRSAPYRNPLLSTVSDPSFLCRSELSPEQEALYAGLHHFWNLTYGSAQRKRAELAALALRDPDDTELQAEVAAQLSSILVKIRISLMPVLVSPARNRTRGPAR